MTELMREGSARQKERSGDPVDRGDTAWPWTPRMEIHFFFSAFCADLVTFPPEAAFFSTDLMTPTATVCLMSRTAKRPVKRRWTQEKGSNPHSWVGQGWLRVFYCHSYHGRLLKHRRRAWRRLRVWRVITRHKQFKRLKFCMC